MSAGSQNLEDPALAKSQSTVTCMLVVCVNDPLCAVICAVYDTGVVVVVTVFELDPPPPPQPTITPTNRSAHTPILIRVRSSLPRLADHPRKTKITKQTHI